ncbi:MAG: acyltransferase family protein [Verrucomicrobiota bacterium]
MRISGIDSVKALAAFAVVYLHTPRSDALHWQVLTQFARFAVPFFFIISGYFFTLSHLRGEPIAKIFFRYVLRIGIILAAWLVFYDFIAPYIGGDAPRFKMGWIVYQWAVCPLSSQHGPSFHPWFLFALIEGLAMLAFFLALNKPIISTSLCVGMFIGGLLISSYSATPLGIHTSANALMTPFFSTLFVWIGSTLASSGFKYKPTFALMVFLLGFAFQLGEAWVLKSSFGTPLQEPNFLVGTIPFALGAVLVAFSFPGIGGVFNLKSIGKYSLGIYVLHPYLLEILKKQTVAGTLSALPLLLAIVVFMATAGSAWLCSRNRHLARLFC